MKGALKTYQFNALILLLVAVTYGSTLGHDYALDDVIVITENDRVQNGLSDIPSFFKNIKSEQTQHRYGYRPISLLSYATIVQFFGLDPFWQHLLNLILYSLLCILIFKFLRALFSTLKPEIVAIAVVIFTVHPIHTEVVANVKSRDEILAMLFGVLYLWQILKWLDNKQKKPLLLALVFAIMAFLSKENAIGYAAVGLALPILRAPIFNKQRIFEMLPAFVSLTVILAIYGFSISLLDENSFDLYEKGLYHEDRYVANPLIDHSMWSRLMHAFLILGLELKLFLIPHPLIHDYGFQTIPLIDSMIDWRWVVGLLITVSAVFFAGRYIKKNPLISFSVLFWLVTTVIYLHVPIAGPDFFGERFLFGPSLGLSLIMAYVLFQVSSKIQWLIIIAVIIATSGATYIRALDWKSTNVLFEADKPHLENCARFQYNYANMLHHAYYDLPPRAKQNEQSVILSHYEKALEITDRILLAYLDLGSAYMEFGKQAKAEAVFNEAVIKYNHLSAPHYQLGQYYLSQNMLEDALLSYANALDRGEKNASTYYMKAVCEIKLGKLESARKTLIDGKPYGGTEPNYLELMQKLNVQ